MPSHFIVAEVLGISDLVLLSRVSGYRVKRDRKRESICELRECKGVGETWC